MRSAKRSAQDVDSVIVGPDSLALRIRSSTNLVGIANRLVSYESQPRRGSCLLVNSSKIQQILAKAARNKRTKSDVFLVSLHFDEELESIKTYFGSEFDKQLEELIITEFVYVTHI